MVHRSFTLAVHSMDVGREVRRDSWGNTSFRIGINPGRETFYGHDGRVRAMYPLAPDDLAANDWVLYYPPEPEPKPEKEKPRPFGFGRALGHMHNGRKVRHIEWPLGCHILAANSTIYADGPDRTPEEWIPTPRHIRSAGWELLG